MFKWIFSYKHIVCVYKLLVKLTLKDIIAILSTQQWKSFILFRDKLEEKLPRRKMGRNENNNVVPVKKLFIMATIILRPKWKQFGSSIWELGAIKLLMQKYASNL